jgi:5-methylcytosine-specific restriction endonuclease McrA
MDHFISYATEKEIKSERSKARSLKKSQWWKRKRADGICYFCKRKIMPKELTLDHIVPIIRGGKSTKGNVAPVCKECNDKKKYLLPIEWEEYLERLNRDS